METIQLDALMVDTNNSDHADWADAKFLTEVSASENHIYSDTYEIAGGQATIPEGTTVQEHWSSSMPMRRTGDRRCRRKGNGAGRAARRRL
mgnify:CR=1 FL=1